ncbi:hypothetical protein HYR69_06180 [Candidatus Sumerlaeota bacterium]|nr:hypothetical protein [Candidatus Sumerlaeota bacterium]MBI3736573.1 hypothetical protein [Candidatus Sumerlaeota bacterium]
MSVNAYDRILGEAGALTREEQLKLAETLSLRLQTAPVSSPSKPRWEDYAGKGVPLQCGEDAQAWVKRSRQESDHRRKIA